MAERANPAQSTRECCGVYDAWFQPCADCPTPVPLATAGQAAEAMQLSIDRASVPPEVLDLIRDPDLSIPGDPLAP